MKKLFRVILALVMILALAAGCQSPSQSEKTSPSPSGANATSSSPSPSATEPESNVYPENGLPKDEDVTLKFALFEGGNGREYADDLVAAFTSKFPNVKIEITASPKIADIINARITANDDKDMFDIFTKNGVNVDDLIRAGKLEAYDILDRETYDDSGKKLRDLIPEATYQSALVDENGNPYEINTSVSMRGLFYNKAFFKQNGWNENPQTWSEFLELCETIKATGISPIVSYGNYLAYLVEPKILEMANVVGDNEIHTNYLEYSVPYYSSKAYVELHKRLAELGSKGYIDKGSGTVTHTESQMMAIQNRAAMVPSGTWIENEMKVRRKALNGDT